MESRKPVTDTEKNRQRRLLLISFASHATAASRLAPCTRELRGRAHPAAVRSECPPRPRKTRLQPSVLNLANLAAPGSQSCKFGKIGGFENRPAACASKLNPALSLNVGSSRAPPTRVRRSPPAAGSHMLTCTLPACILTCNRLTHWQAFKLFLMHVPNYNTHVNTQQNACQHAFEISTCMSKKSTCQHTKNCASTSQECMSTCIQNFNMHFNKKYMSTYRRMQVDMHSKSNMHVKIQPLFLMGQPIRKWPGGSLQRGT